MKTILVPTDFSKNSENAIDYAISIAKKEKYKVILLHAYHPIISPPSFDLPVQYYSEAYESIQKKASDKLNELKDKIVKKGKLACDILFQEGLAADVIIDVAKKKKVELVIMGSKGASGLTKVILGSITAKVIEKSNRPVIAVPEKATFDGIGKIAYATQYHSSDMTALKKLAELSKSYKATIHLVHIADGAYTIATEKEYMEKFKEKVKKAINIKSIEATVIEGDNIEKELERYFKKNAISLLVISTKHRNFIEKLFGKSITKTLIFHSKVPLLVFHHKQSSVALI
ncbi:MAG TPA: universal stress protein [Bacteroidia bacterium]|nr:universal stress protein [Bacteroidia bacterium]